MTFRPNMPVGETASWMGCRSADSVLVTSSDGTFLGVLRRGDLNVPRQGKQGAGA